MSTDAEKLVEITPLILRYSEAYVDMSSNHFADCTAKCLELGLKLTGDGDAAKLMHAGKAVPGIVHSQVFMASVVLANSLPPRLSVGMREDLRSQLHKLVDDGLDEGFKISTESAEGLVETLEEYVRRHSED